MIWTVSAPARLHFGLLDLSGDMGRIDGGAGVALATPRVVVRARAVAGGATPAKEIAPLASRLADCLRVDLSRVELEVVETLPAHIGLGSHTQLALALGTALCKATGRDCDPLDIARTAGRGGTSGIGVHAFRQGGLVVDGGHTFGPGEEKEVCRPSSASRAPVAPLLARFELPAEWRFALITPTTERGASGTREVSLFEEAFPLPGEETAVVCRHLLLGLMPAAARGDAALFGRTLSALQAVGFKRREVALQPAPVRELLDVMVSAGAQGAGLSSFGPTVFALATDEENARSAVAAATEHLRGFAIDSRSWIAAPDNRGAIVSGAEES